MPTLPKIALQSIPSEAAARVAEALADALLPVVEIMPPWGDSPRLRMSESHLHRSWKDCVFLSEAFALRLSDARQAICIHSCNT